MQIYKSTRQKRKDFSYENRPRAKVQDYAPPINRVLPDLFLNNCHTLDLFNLEPDLDISTRKQRQRENGSTFKTSSPDVNFVLNVMK